MHSSNKTVDKLLWLGFGLVYNPSLLMHSFLGGTVDTDVKSTMPVYVKEGRPTTATMSKQKGAQYHN
jgi:hypothetical protein